MRSSSKTIGEEIRRPDIRDIEKHVGAGRLPVIDDKHNIEDTHTEHGRQHPSAWLRKDEVIFFVAIWFISFVNALQQGASQALAPNITSDFNRHSLTPYVSVVAYIVGGVLRLPLGMILDVWGRPHGFVLCLASVTLGLILMAACNSLHVYTVAQVFYWFGQNGLRTIFMVLVSDMTKLRNRVTALAFEQSPFLITVWIAGPIADGFLNGPGWRWLYGTFAAITVVTSMPMLALLILYHHPATGHASAHHGNGRTVSQSVRYYFTKLDAGFLVLITGGLIFTLLPFSVYSFQDGGWGSPLVISFFIIGGLMLIAAFVYEKSYSPKPLIPIAFLRDRTIVGAFVLCAVLFISFYLWNVYFISFLQVIYGLTITEATWVGNIYTAGSCLSAFGVGVAIRWTGRFKWLTLYIGLPITVVGNGLMIQFCQPNEEIGYLIMCQLLIAFAGGVCWQTEQIAAFAAAQERFGQDHRILVITLEGMTTMIAGAIGSSVATAIWTGVFPVKLAEYLPSESQAQLGTIYGNLTNQLTYPKGSPTRVAIESAYGDAQMLMCAASTAVLAVGLVATALWKDIEVEE